jgi:DNA-directed RNA polymerase subunit F
LKAFRIAVCSLVLLIVAVFVNSAYIKNLTAEFANEVDKINESDPDAASKELTELFSKFKKAEKVISITTSHDDLTSIEETFAEMMGAVNAKDMNELIKIKSRLKSSFEHLGRLSGINIDSVI